MRNLSLQLLDDSVISSHHLVRLHFLKDHFGSVCEFQRGDGFLRVVGQGTHRCDQRGLRVAAQTVLQQPCQF